MNDRPEKNEPSGTGASSRRALAWFAPLRRLEWDVAAAVLFIKFSLFLFVLAAVPALSNRATPLEILLNRWDAQRYLAIARDGYVATGEARQYLVGLPLYSWLVRAVSWLGLDLWIAALVVSGIASLAVAWWFLRLMRFDLEERHARLALWFLFIFPTSYFLHIAYTEGTLLAFALGSFVAARRQQWALCGILGGLAALSRLNGLILFPALVFEAWAQYRAMRRWEWRWLWLAGIPAGFAVYLWLNYRVTGDPFAFMSLMAGKFDKELATPWAGMLSIWENLRIGKPEDLIMVGAAEALFTALAAGATIWSWCRLRLSYSIWMTGNLLLGICSSFVIGVPRYALVMFPIFILFARVARERPIVFAGLTLWSILLLALFFLKFALGHWAF